MAEGIELQSGYSEWTIKDFSEGYIDSIDDNLLPDNATKDCQNVISRKIGYLQKRPGQSRLNSTALGGAVQGLHAYYYGSNRRLVVAAGGAVAYWDVGTSAFVNIKTGLHATAQTCFETCVNYMVVFNGTNAPWKWDGTTASNLANAPSDGMLAVLYKEKLFTVPTSSPSTLKWSDSFQPESWPAVNYWDVRKGDGDKITCLKVHLGQLAIFKRRSLSVLAGTSLDDFKLDEIDGRIGCVGPFAAAVYGPYLYFVSDDGLCVFNGMNVTNISEGIIRALWGTINKQYLHKAAVTIWDGLVWFALPEGTSTTNNLVIVYVPPDQGAVGGKFWLWRGINASCFQVYNDGLSIVLYSGDAVNGYVNKQYVGNNDFGYAINAYWQGKAFDIGLPEHEKKFKKVFIQDSPGDTDVSLAVALDYGTYNALTYEAGDALVRRYRFPIGTYGRYMSPKIMHNATGGFGVRGLTVLYRPKAKPM